jgi:hypothetical protein
MSKAVFHAWMYDPKTGEGRIFDDADDVPKGWVDRVPEEGGEEPEVKTKAKSEPKDKPVADASVMTRAEIMTALKGGGVDFAVTAKTEVLHDLLKAKVTEVLTQRSIAFDADASVRDLLAKLA